MMLAASSPALAVEPRPITSPKQIKPQHGAVRLSVQSQVQQQGTIHVWFLREGGDPAQSADVLKFERKQGVPLLGMNTVDSRPAIYSLPPGRYRLLAYGVACPMLPPPGTYACSATMNNIPLGQMPARRYEGEVPSFDVEAGKLTEVGEFILEAGPDAPISEGAALKFLQRDHRAFELRVRPTSVPRAAAFVAIAAGPAPNVPAGFESRISCRQRPKGAMMYLPFTC
nr:hypothetical protein [uncultured Sphingosinicella sp.]